MPDCIDKRFVNTELQQGYKALVIPLHPAECLYALPQDSTMLDTA